VIAVPVVRSAPSRNAVSTNVRVASARRPSAAMIASSSALRLAATKTCHSSSIAPSTVTRLTKSSMRSRLLRSDGLASTAREISARSSLSSPSPWMARNFSTSMRM